jgi:hypothetical protein
MGSGTLGFAWRRLRLDRGTLALIERTPPDEINVLQPVLQSGNASRREAFRLS